MKFKKLCCVIAALAILTSCSVSALATVDFEDEIRASQGAYGRSIFYDVPADYWAKNQIDSFVQQGIINGYDDGSFHPDSGVTREEFCKLLVSAFKQTPETPTTPSFADVSKNRWSYPYIEMCKEFLTGYASPFGGLPSFHPAEYATREDMAVALVRMMGYTAEDATNSNYASRTFSDGSMISPKLVPYVSIACEKGLITGYPDGSFGPTQGITRAETVVLLNRALKQAFSDFDTELQMSAELSYSADKKTVTITVLAEKGSTVTVNGETVKLSKLSYSNTYSGTYTYVFEDEGSQNFVIVGKRIGTSKTINLTANYKISTPVLKITDCPSSSDDHNITIAGTVSDANDSIQEIEIQVNGKPVDGSVSRSDKTWKKKLTLDEGRNVITVTATNIFGRSVTETVNLDFAINPPEIVLYNCPETTTNSVITIAGQIEGNNTKAKLFINDEEVIWTSSFGFSSYYRLKEGTNTVKIRAVNAYGKEAVMLKTVTYSKDAPSDTPASDPAPDTDNTDSADNAE